MTDMRALPFPLRKQLEASVLAARRAAESASRAAIEGLGVSADHCPEHLDLSQAALRDGLRAKWLQLGGDRELLVAECAYEQWHRLLFARFLAENGLLLHPQYKAPVTLADCEQLATELGEPDAWSVAARFAAEILPGIFRLDDPCVRLRLAPEGRYALEQILDALPAKTFTADDALGWVYQFWQKDKKEVVNASERKIGGADLGPVTQLFTENYMVRFLLENSLGAWWATRHPDSPLVKGFDYLRFDDDGRSAAGSFDGWPDRVAEVTLMDPCCGSGHFLVEAFSMLWQMRAEEENLAPVDAQDAVLRDNLFGLELDARCVQIAMFTTALKAWTAGGGWRQLPVPNIACSGIPVKSSVEEWRALARGDARLENALVRLHILFRDADTLGSLIDPKRAIEISDPTGRQPSFDDIDWDEIAPLLVRAVEREGADPATAVLGADATGIVRATDLLSRNFTLITTNVPYLKRGNQSEFLKAHLDRVFSNARADLGISMFQRFERAALSHSVVLPQAWTFTKTFIGFRRSIVARMEIGMLAYLGPGAFDGISGEVVKPVLFIASGLDEPRDAVAAMDVSSISGTPAKMAALCKEPLVWLERSSQLRNPESRIIFTDSSHGTLMGDVTDCAKGLSLGDGPRYQFCFWEIFHIGKTWTYMQSTVGRTIEYGGRSWVVRWEGGSGDLADEPSARVQGRRVWGKAGILVSLMNLQVSLYSGDAFDQNSAVLAPHNQNDLAAIWLFCGDINFAQSVRVIDRTLKVTNASLTQIPFDVEFWRSYAATLFPDGLPRPWSNDPTQWLFGGRPEVSTAPLQVAIARLVGYRWPEQAEIDGLDTFADVDGIVCLPPVAGEAPAADRVQQLLAAAFGDEWSPVKVRELLEEAGSKKNLADWLRDEFFLQHCALFGNRPFVWHIWDGQRDGFSALVNYHRLDRRTLEKLTYTYLGQGWVERQRAEVRDDVAGAEARLSAALGLQRKLEAILEGEAPLDIYVRWKETREQPIGWEPDVNDGVRLNVRPFVQAGVLRAPFNIRWRKDRGKNTDGSERENDKHLALAEKTEARRRAGRK